MLLLAYIAVLFAKHVLKQKYIGWDTFDVHTVRFTFLSDSLKSGYFALWNPFTLSGEPLYPNLFAATLFNPLDLIFLLLSLFIDPVYVVDLSVLFCIWIGGIGFYKLFDSHEKPNPSLFHFVLSAIFVAILFAPIVGQLPFVCSLAALPWFLVYINTLRDDPNFPIGKTIFYGFLISVLFARGYFYFNACIGLFYILYALINFQKLKNKFTRNLGHIVLFGITSIALYIVLNIDGLIQLGEMYAGLNGNLVVPEPRIRPIKSDIFYYHSSAQEAALVFLWPGFVKIITWTSGMMHAIPLLIASILLIRRKHFRSPLFLIAFALILYGFFTSYGSYFAIFINKFIPILNSNRWSFTNLYFAEMGSLILIGVTLKDYFENQKRPPSFLIKTTFLWLLFLINLIVMKDKIRHQYKYSNLKNDVHFYARPTSVEIIKNERSLGNSSDFLYSDLRWLAQKEPFTHGYLNTVHFLYWYMKDAEFLKQIVQFSSSYRIEKEPQLKFERDNDLVDFKIKQIDFSGKNYIVLNKDPKITSRQATPYQIQDLLITPNKAKFKINVEGPGMFSFFNQWAPGWHVTINGKDAELYKTNLVFMGVTLPQKGVYDILFTYEPKTIAMVIIFNLILIGYVISFFLRLLYCKVRH